MPIVMYVLIIPVIWGFAGFIPVLMYEVYPDIGLIVTGIAALMLMFTSRNT